MVDQNSPDDAYSDKEYSEALDAAKGTLLLISQCRVPPTPEVFELYYRYIEGKNKQLVERVSYFVNDLKSINRAQLESLLREFGSNQLGGTVVASVSSGLASEVKNLQKLTESQLTAGEDFDASLHSASGTLETETGSTESLREWISHLLSTNEKMYTEITNTRRALETSLAQIESLGQRLAEVNKALATDELTGVGNRNYYNTLVRDILANAALDNEGLFFLFLIDVDNFKWINDSFGHDCGDGILQHVATQLGRLAGQDAVARFGGDEFAIVLQDKRAEFGAEMADELLREVSAQHFKVKEHDGMIGRITLSVGVAILRPDDTCDSWFERADKLLYSAKRAGRNCFRCERNLR